MTAVSRSCFALAPLFQKSSFAKSESRKKRNLFFFVSPFFPSFCPIFLIKTQKRHFLIKKAALLIKKKRSPKKTFFDMFGLFFCWSKGSFFDQKAHFFDQKFPLFFFIMVSVWTTSFFCRRYRPTSYQVSRDLRKYTETILCLNFFRQTGTGPRPTHCGPHGKSELCVQRADSTSDHWSLSLRWERERESL